MKEKKPFKLGASYKLKQKYIGEYIWSIGMDLVFGETPYAFTFTPYEIDNAGSAWCKSRSGRRTLICVSERHMFKRIDNKE